jgi:hypothetical protein
MQPVRRFRSGCIAINAQRTVANVLKSCGAEKANQQLNEAAVSAGGRSWCKSMTRAIDHSAAAWCRQPAGERFTFVTLLVFLCVRLFDGDHLHAHPDCTIGAFCDGPAPFASMCPKRAAWRSPMACSSITRL